MAVPGRAGGGVGEGTMNCLDPQASCVPQGAGPWSPWGVNTAQHFFPRIPTVGELMTSLLVKQLVTEADPIFTPGERAKGQASPQAA